MLRTEHDQIPGYPRVKDHWLHLTLIALCLGQFSHPHRPIFNLRIWLYSINSLIGKLSVTHWPIIGREI